MKISVIISTYNSPEWLSKVLWGYEYQTVKPHELVIADDGSGEATRALIEEFSNQSHLRINHVWQPDDGFQKCAILNKAIEASSGDYLLFTDGDCVPHPHLMKMHLALSEPGKFLSGGYCKLPMPTSEAINQKAIKEGNAFSLSWLRNHGFSWRNKWLKVLAPSTGMAKLLDALSPAKKTFNGNNSSCFRGDAIAVCGFDERMGYGGEDREFGYRLENSGVTPKGIRYSALCLHLDHPRGYKNEEIRRYNEAIIADTKRLKRTTTEHGLKEIV